MKIFSLFLTINFYMSFLCANEYPVKVLGNPFNGSRFYAPNGSKINKTTSIILLHGSEGGTDYFSHGEAKVLSSLGYNVIVLCYFDCNRKHSFPKQSLQNIDPTIVFQAISWLKKQKISNGKVFVYGRSRGAELAMIVGSLSYMFNDKPSGIIAHAPSNVYSTIFNGGWREKVCWLCTVNKNKCLDSPIDIHNQWKRPSPLYSWNDECGAENDPRKIDFSHSPWVINSHVIPRNKRIEIEKFDGPILITVGVKDQIWPVEYTRDIETNLKKSGHKNFTIYYFENSLHWPKAEDELKRKNFVLKFLKEN